MISDNEGWDDFLIEDVINLILSRKNPWPIYFTKDMKFEFLNLLILKCKQLDKYEQIIDLENIKGELANAGD